MVNGTRVIIHGSIGREMKRMILATILHGDINYKDSNHIYVNTRRAEGMAFIVEPNHGLRIHPDSLNPKSLFGTGGRD